MLRTFLTGSFIESKVALTMSEEKLKKIFADTDAEATKILLFDEHKTPNSINQTSPVASAPAEKNLP